MVRAIDEVDEPARGESEMRTIWGVIRLLALAAMVAMGLAPGLAVAGQVVEGPAITNPPIAEGTLPKGAKGFASKASGATAGKQSKPQTLAEVAVSDQCYVTRVDYCVMESYAPVGSSCVCTDGYYYYNGVVY